MRARNRQLSPAQEVFVKTAQEIHQFWYDLKWWRDPVYDGRKPHSIEYREQILSNLSKIFDEKWCYEAIGFYQAHVWFHGEGTMPFDNLLALADDCFLAQQKGLFNKALREALKSSDRCAGAHFELQILGHLLRNGIVPERPPKIGRNADFLVHDKFPIFVEVKRADIAKDTNDARSLTYQLIGPARSCIPLGINYKFMLGDQLRALLETKAGLIEARKNLEYWQKELQARLANAVSDRLFQIEIGVAGICTCILFEGSPGRSDGGLEGAQVVPEFEVSKLYRDVLNTARQQIPKDGTGVVLIHVEHLLPDIAALIEEHLRLEPIPNVSMVILYQGVYVTEPEMRCLEIINPSAKEDISNLTVINILTHW